MEVANVIFSLILLAKMSHITKLDTNGTSIIRKLCGKEEVLKRIPMGVIKISLTNNIVYHIWQGNFSLVLSFFSCKIIKIIILPSPSDCHEA